MCTTEADNKKPCKSSFFSSLAIIGSLTSGHPLCSREVKSILSFQPTKLFFRFSSVNASMLSMKVDLGIWTNLTRLVTFLLCVAGLLGLAVWYLPVIKQNERMREEILRLDTKIRKEEDQARRLKASVDALRLDPRAVERLARESLGYAKPGETVIRFQGPITNHTAQR
jgi:cell division protein FtsB